ncbi:hypothetical protein [Pseudovibrio sp. Ad26]|uniref:hypothetical protein n=1 Tax=Pseudovibrio sp. Ad26 TaxID=989410 RepID=UPI0007AEA757|nr:hypothetical protein [Pseudovibrio sp. Ad26]KZL14836.1 hypothetical protein PsAD26_01179 [Pseudovibrio sp. Ad26]
MDAFDISQSWFVGGILALVVIVKQKQYIKTLVLAFAAMLAAYNAQAEGGRISRECKELSKITPDVELPMIAAAVSECASHRDPTRKLSIFLSGLIKVQFDARRVEGTSVRSATMFYQMLTFLKMTEAEKEQFKRDGKEFAEEARILTCDEMGRQGPPTYHPWWFVKVAQEKSQHERAGKIKEIDAAAEWDAVLTKFCSSK